MSWMLAIPIIVGALFLGAAGEVDEVSLSYNGTGSYAYIQNMADIVAVFAVKAGLNDTEPLNVLTMDARRIRWRCPGCQSDRPRHQQSVEQYNGDFME